MDKIAQTLSLNSTPYQRNSTEFPPGAVPLPANFNPQATPTVSLGLDGQLALRFATKSLLLDSHVQIKNFFSEQAFTPFAYSLLNFHIC